MRSKEVEEAINDLTFIVITDIYGNEVRIDKPKVINGYNQSVGTVLDYIEELEKENKYLRDENNIYKNETVSKNKIRDKLIELAKKLTEPNDDRWEKDDNAYYEKIKAQIRVLKEIIGE